MMAGVQDAGGVQTHGATGALWDCPTCGARQVVADECRRCRCDLRLLGQLLTYRQELERQGLAWMAQRRLRRAEHAFTQLYHVSRDATAARLLAVCYLLAGKFAAGFQTLMAQLDRGVSSVPAPDRDPTDT